MSRLTPERGFVHNILAIWTVRVAVRLAGKLGPIPLRRDFEGGSEWYAKGVGLIKSQSEGGINELLSLSKGQ